MRDMTVPRLTRRALLTAAAGSGVLAAAPERVFGWTAVGAQGPVGGAPRVFALVLGDLDAGTHRVRAPASFDLVGVQWSAPAAAKLSLRTIGAGGVPAGGWASMAASGHGPDRVTASATLGGDPVWTGRAQDLEIRAEAPVQGVVLRFVAVARSTVDAATSAALALAGPVLDAGPGQPPIIAREAWAQGAAPAPSAGAGYGAVRLGFVHHTASPNGYSSADVSAMLRAIWAYHVHANGWQDIGYNFVIDSFGRTFEARAGGIDEPVVGAQAGGYNLVSTGVAVLGDFSAAPVSAPALGALQRLLAWKLSLHGAPTTGRVSVRVNPAGAIYSRFPGNAVVSLPRIAGHRDADTTDCPGNALYAELSALRQRASVLAGRVLVATLTAPAATFTAPGPAALSGALTAADGSPIAGVPIALQSRALAGSASAPLESQVAELTTDANGQFSVSLPISFNAALRALFTGASGLPATVSEPLNLSVAPVLTLTAASTVAAVATPVTLTGTVSPAVARVLVTVSAAPASGGRATVSTHHLLTSGGAFGLTFAPARPGTYRCVASTPADLQSAAGTSPAVTLAVS